MKILSVLVTMCALASGTAFAGIYGSANVTATDSLGMTVEVGQGAEAIFAGLVSLTVQSTSALSGLPANAYFQGDGSYSAFCIDLYDPKPTTTEQPYSVKPLDESPDPMASPVGGMGSINAGLIAGLLTSNTYKTALDAAAMQVAIWEIIEEENPFKNYDNGNGWDVGDGDFFLTNLASNSLVISTANAMLSNLVSADFSRYIALADSSDYKNYQDFVVVPVPASLLLGLIGMGVAGVKMRKSA